MSPPETRPSSSALGARVVAALDRARLAVDDLRIRAHLRRTERALRARDVSALSPTKRARRARHLDRLRAYRQRGQFPRNDAHCERTPCFVGRDGTRCAVGALLAADGETDLVERIAERNNTVRVEDLESGPLLSWVKANGFTQAEAARIQPGYPHTVEFASGCGPVSCRVAALVVSLVALTVCAVCEFVGYRLVGGWFPDNALKRRVALGYLTVMNIFAAPLLALVLYALFP